MSKELLIVESPAKSKTINKFLGDNFEVLSSYGHIRDLKTKDMGVNVDNNFELEYEVTSDKNAVVQKLKSAAKKADKVWLASDEDREGEAIAWHLSQVLGLDTQACNRIVFHEITPKAIQHALQNPRKIDLQMVDAQQARRVLDRIVGFELSPVLWHKIKPSLSAGRVQSVAVRILVEREREIRDFIPQSSYRVRGKFCLSNGSAVMAELDQRLKGANEAKTLLQSLADEHFNVSNVEVKPGKRLPAPPFTTSTLQQEAARKLGISVAQTMRIAQKLYEAGYITYMRTDSVNLSSFAISAAAQEIEKAYGKSYVRTRNFTTRTKGAQEAHEAIRPTQMDRLTVVGTKQDQALYDLIRKRTLASQMSEALLERTQVTLKAESRPISFIARGEVVKFDGFLKVYFESTDDDYNEDEITLLPELRVGDPLSYDHITATERFTQRPARYTEASLVKKMEELGIGRPSTYAPTIQTIQKRDYVERKTIEGVERKYMELVLKKGKVKEMCLTEKYGSDRNKLVPTDIGIVVTDYLVEHFPSVMNYNFTAEVEEEFDNIAEGKREWQKVIASFYNVFHPHVEKVMETTNDKRAGERVLGTDPTTGRVVSARIGRYGPMVQIGDSGNGDAKPQFASIPSGLSLETITLGEALKLFALPRKLGEYEGKEIEANNGRFGPYVKQGGLFVSIPSDISVYEITLDQAIELIQAKKETEKNKQIAVFGDGADAIQVLRGRFGPYISYKKKNYKIPKTLNPEELTEEQVKNLITEAAPKRSSTKQTSGKRSSSKS